MTEPVHVSEVLDGPMVGCPACGGIGEGCHKDLIVECSVCDGEGLLTVAAAQAWTDAHPWGFGDNG